MNRARLKSFFVSKTHALGKLMFKIFTSTKDFEKFMFPKAQVEIKSVSNLLIILRRSKREIIDDFSKGEGNFDGNGLFTE